VAAVDIASAFRRLLAALRRTAPEPVVLPVPEDWDHIGPVDAMRCFSARYRVYGARPDGFPTREQLEYAVCLPEARPLLRPVLLAERAAGDGLVHTATGKDVWLAVMADLEGFLEAHWVQVDLNRRSADAPTVHCVRNTLMDDHGPHGWEAVGGVRRCPGWPLPMADTEKEN